MTQPQPGSLGATHLAGRLAVAADDAQHDGWGGTPVPGHLLAMHQVWAFLYAELLSDGDTGAAFSHLHHLRHDEPDVDPWRLLEHAVRRALALGSQPEPASPRESHGVLDIPLEGVVLQPAERAAIAAVVAGAARPELPAGPAIAGVVAGSARPELPSGPAAPAALVKGGGKAEPR